MRKGQIGLAFAIIFSLMVLMAFAFIEPLKESLDANRGGTTLNCPGTPTFNQTAYDEQNASAKLIYRPTCLATGLSMVHFVGSVLVVGCIWVYRNWVQK